MEEFLTRKSFLFGNIFVRKDEGIPNFEGMLQDLDSILNSSKITKNEVYVRAGVFNLSGKEYFIKRYSSRNIFYQIGYLFKKNRAEHAWFASLLLEKNSISNPKSYVVYSRRFFGFIKTSYLITEAVNDVFSSDYFKTIFSNLEQSEIFYEKIIKQIALVHNVGIFHSDAKLWNFYIYKDVLSHDRIGIWDLDGAVIYRELPLKKRILDLSRTIASIIELNKEAGKDIYNSIFIDKMISFYGKYADCHLKRTSLEKIIGKFLAKKKIFRNHF